MTGARPLLRMARGLTVALACLACLPSPGSAFCREQVGARPDEPCMELPGVPLLFWSRGCFTYTFNQNLFARIPALSEQATRDIFKLSFATWTQLDCGQSGRFFVEQAPGTTPTSRAEFVRDARNESVINARTPDEWSHLPDHDARTVALTLLWHNTTTGEIFDVDMDLNLGIGRFADCERQVCRPGMVDLQNTITHEAGHVFGLGHSDVADSTMEFSTGQNLSELGKRTLESDDVEGYCSLELPAWNCAGAKCSCPPAPILPSKRVRTCACSSLGQAGSAPRWSWSWVAAGLWFGRRRRPRQ